MTRHADNVKKMMRLLERGVINEHEASSQAVDSLIFVHADAKHETIDILQDLPTSVLTEVCHQLVELSSSDDPYWHGVRRLGESMLARRQGENGERDAQQ